MPATSTVATAIAREIAQTPPEDLAELDSFVDGAEDETVPIGISCEFGPRGGLRSIDWQLGNSSGYTWSIVHPADVERIERVVSALVDVERDAFMLNREFA